MENMMRGMDLSKWLWLLTLIFIFRVLGQFSVQWGDVSFLPSFDRWYSGALEYHYLLASQCLIIFVMSLVSYRIGKALLRPSVKIGGVLQVIGWVYFSVMLVRWVIGVAELIDITWFQRPIPSFFHMVLASYILIVAHYHKFAGLKDE
jgi:hypothetical protein